MGIIEKIGGRKFLLALIVVGVGTAVEIVTERGVSAAFASLLGGIVAAFSAGNYLSKMEYRKSQEDSPGEVSGPVGISQIEASITEVKQATGSIATAVAGVHKLIAANINR